MLILGMFAVMWCRYDVL